MERLTPKQPTEGVDYFSNRDLGDEVESGGEKMYREMQNFEREQERLRREIEQLTDDGYAIK